MWIILAVKSADRVVLLFIIMLADVSLVTSAGLIKAPGEMSIVKRIDLTVINKTNKFKKTPFHYV